MAVKKSGKTAEAKKITVKPEDIKVDRAKEFEKSISFDITLFGCIKVYRCTYRTYEKNGEEKGIISFPSKKGKDDEYYDLVYFYVSDKTLAAVEKEIEALI